MRLSFTRLSLAVSLAGSAACSSAYLHSASPPSPDSMAIRRDIEYLASDRLEGRLSGTPGNDTAAAYLARSLQIARPHRADARLSPALRCPLGRRRSHGPHGAAAHRECHRVASRQRSRAQKRVRRHRRALRSPGTLDDVRPGSGSRGRDPQWRGRQRIGNRGRPRPRPDARGKSRRAAR